MSIPAVSSDYSVNQLAVDLNNKTEDTAEVIQGAQKEETATSKYAYLTDGFQETDDFSDFKEIVSEYDITDISKNEAKQLYRNLYNSDLISLKDLYITFDYSTFPTEQETPAQSSAWDSTSTPDDKINLVDNLKTQVANIDSADTSSVSIAKSNLSLAEKIYYFQTQK